MKIAISGSTGFIGQSLALHLTQRGDDVVAIGRRELARGAQFLASHIAGCDALINLAGAPIDKRWTNAYKNQIVSSRLNTTRLLVDAMVQMDEPCATFISTSAIGAFDSHGQYGESDTPNATDFLGQLSRAWEAAALEAGTLGVRTLIFRLGLVLGHEGGLMRKVLPPFRMGLGGPIGDGTQPFSWIHLHDLINAYSQALDDDAWSGTYHLCTPQPVTNLEFTRTMGDLLHRPTLFRVPHLMLRLALGEGAEVITSGQSVVSERLPVQGFRFQYADLESALKDIIRQPVGGCPVTEPARSGART